MRPRGKDHTNSVMKKAFIRHRLIRAAVGWYKSGCPYANEAGDGPMGELEDAIHEYIDHEEQVEERKRARSEGARTGHAL